LVNDARYGNKIRTGTRGDANATNNNTGCSDAAGDGAISFTCHGRECDEPVRDEA